MEVFSTSPDYMTFEVRDRTARFVRVSQNQDMHFHAAFFRLDQVLDLSGGKQWVEVSFSWFGRHDQSGDMPPVFEAYLEQGAPENRNFNAASHPRLLDHAWGRETLVFELDGSEVDPIIGLRFSDPRITLMTFKALNLTVQSSPQAPTPQQLQTQYAPFVKDGWFPDPFMQALHDVVRLYYTPVLERGGDAIDIGANKGFHTHAMRNAFRRPDQKLIAVEPHPTLHRALQQGFAGDPQVDITNVLIGSRAASDVSFTYSETHHELGSARPNYIEEFFPDIEDDFETIRMDMLNVDVLVDQFGLTPGFIKIDVEGFELEVLHGAHKTFENFRPVVAFEFNVTSSPNNSYLLADMFDHFDYVIFDCFGNRLGATTWCNPSIAPIDRVAIPAEQAEAVMAAVQGPLDQHWREWQQAQKSPG